MTLLHELIEIPTEVHKSDFVISLKSAVREPEKTMAEYVVTPQLAGSFDRALSLITSAVREGRSKASYLHASFGAGKSAFMAVTDLLLQGAPAARSKPELSTVVAKYAGDLNNRTFLLVPYHAMGAETLEQIVLGGYVEYIAERHAEAPVPAVYVADGILDDAAQKRGEQGDEVFFRVLSEGDTGDDEWGELAAGWDGDRFEAARTAPAGSAERDELVSALLRTHHRAFSGMAQSTAQGFVPLDQGLNAISRHAKALGYDAVVLFLDELVLWLAARISDREFVSREGAKFVKLVEDDRSKRPAPIVSLIARQRDLRELVGEEVLGIEGVSVTDVLKHSEGRFDTITLEDRNLRAIAQHRLLRPKSESARQALNDAFEQASADAAARNERDVLLTDDGELDEFRSLYPFSPALVETLVALSGTMQRERTALKAMLHLLVDHRDRLEVGQLVPLGDLYDVVTAEDPLTPAMKAQFDHARKLWRQRFEPLLLRQHRLEPDQVAGLPAGHPFVTDARLLKSLLVAALVPEVPALKGLTVGRLTALNSGIVGAFVPGTERQLVLDKLRGWSAEVSEIRIGGDDLDPTVSVAMTGIDTEPIIESARSADNPGQRILAIKRLLTEEMGLKEAADGLELRFEWRGTDRRMTVLFANVRDKTELPDESLRAGSQPKLVIDLPWDQEGYSPSDDRARVEEYRDAHREWTAVWLPNFFTEAAVKVLSRFVRLEYLLTGSTFDTMSGHLPVSDRPAARLQLDANRDAVGEQLRLMLRQTYGLDEPIEAHVDRQLEPHEQFLALDDGCHLQTPVGTSLADLARGVADQLYSYRFPGHPRFPKKVSGADLRHALEQVRTALNNEGGRLENVDTKFRDVLRRVVGPLRLGEMHDAHLIADVQYWQDHLRTMQGQSGNPSPTVETIRVWLDWPDNPTQRRGMPEDMADLVLLAVAAANQQTLTDGVRAVPAEVGKLRPTWELRAQSLPSRDEWQTALERAQAMGVTPQSTALAARAVADLNQQIVDDILSDRANAVGKLPGALRPVAGLVGASPDAPRFVTADAAVRLVTALSTSPEHAAATLAAADVPTSPAALGTSIAQAAALCDSLERQGLYSFRSLSSLSGEDADEAQRIIARLRDAVEADELTVPLAARLNDAERASADLLGRIAARRQPSSTTPTVPASTPPAVAETVSGPQPSPLNTTGASSPVEPAVAGGSRASARDRAESTLVELQQALAAHGLNLVWDIEEA